MDIISTSQLHKYDKILDKINSEFEKSEQLKKEIAKVDDKIVALKLSASSCKNIGHVNIKVFNNVLEIHNLYESEFKQCELQALGPHRDCSLYLIEVILTQCLLDKLLDLEWKLQIRVNCGMFTVCKVIRLSGQTPIMEIIPIDSRIRECTVETCLFLKSETNWNIINLNSVEVDVSYHFQPFKENSVNSLSEDITNISKLYPRNVECIQPAIQVKSHFKCGGDQNNLINSFLQNSYHRLDLEMFSGFFNESKNIVDIQFSVGDEKITILYNKGSNVLKVKCSSNEMLHIKKLFIKQSSFIDHSKFKKKMKSIIEKRRSLEHMDLDAVLSFYQELRKLWL